MSIKTVIQRAAKDGDYAKFLSPEVIEPVIWQTLVSMENQAALLAPVDSGNLRDSITIATNQRSDTYGPRAMFAENQVESPVEDYVGVVGTASEYGAAVEFGRPDMPLYPAQPYLRPALDIIRAKLKRISGEELSKQMSLYAVRHPFRGSASRSVIEGLNK